MARAPRLDEPIGAAEAASLMAPLADLQRLVLAVSGGPDSTALLVLAAAAKAGSPRFPDLLAVTIDHRLRRGSAAEARAVSALAARLGVPHRVRAWTGEKPPRGLPAAARAARYRLLADVAKSHNTPDIALAHTLEDQAETVLMRLAAGSGPAGLAGMRPCLVSGGLVLHRPLLGVPKARLLATLRAHGLSWTEDPTNLDRNFTRPRLRAAAAALAAEGLTAARLARLATRQARAEAALAAATEQAWAAGRHDRCGSVFDTTAFSALPDEIALRVLGRAIERIGTEGAVGLGKLEALLAALAAVVRAQAPAGRSVRRTLAGALVMARPEHLTVRPAPPRRR